MTTVVRAPLGPLTTGVVPLRPLTLTDTFNGAVLYVRANPKATLGFTTIVVLGTQVLALALQIGPLWLAGNFDSIRNDDIVFGLFGSSLSGYSTVVASALAGLLLSGMLTVVIGRAVFGAHVTIGEAWARLRGRLLPLIGLALLEVAVAAVVIVGAVLVVVALGTVSPAAAGLVGFSLLTVLVPAAIFLWTMLSFAPVLIVLEQLGIFAAISRSFTLVRGAFFRVLGIRLLAGLVATVVTYALAVPFAVAGLVVAAFSDSTAWALAAFAVLTVGSVLGDIVTAPFTAGVVVLLYADRRIRAEALDLVLQAGVADPPDSADDIWLIGHHRADVDDHH